MLALAVLILLVVTVAVLSWRARDKPQVLRCCNPGAWPPTDIAGGGTRPPTDRPLRTAREPSMTLEHIRSIDPDRRHHS